MNRFALVVAVSLCMLPTACWLLNSSDRPQTVAAARVLNEPLTIAASTSGGNATTGRWYLSVNSAGKAELTIDATPDRVRREFSISEEQMAALRELLVSERFFELQDAYGELVPDGGIDAITVTIGDESRTVRIHYLMNWIEDRKHRLREPARALRVLLLIRGWFDDPGAADSREHHRMVIEAAEA